MYNDSNINKKMYTELMNLIKLENSEYKKILNSKNYKYGYYINDILNGIKSPKNLSKYLKKVKGKLSWKKLCKKYPICHVNENETKKEPMYFSDEEVIVYTCIFGKYDIPQKPLYKPNNCKFYIITDQEISNDLVWEKYDVSNIILNFNEMSNVEKNRYCKMLPFKIFPNAKKTIYIDGNIKPVTDFTEFINYDMPYGMLFHNHKARECVYQEIDACKILKKANKEDLDVLKKFFEIENFPKKYGMVECNFIVRENDNSIMQSIMLEWWDLFLNSNVKRDQLFLPYILWKNNISIDEVNSLGKNVQENNAFIITQHI